MYTYVGPTELRGVRPGTGAVAVTTPGVLADWLSRRNLDERAEPFTFVVTLVMKLCFRTIAAFSTRESTALPVAAVLLLVLVLYTGFAIPVANIVWALRWITYLNVRAKMCLSFSSELMMRSNSLSVTPSSP